MILQRQLLEHIDSLEKIYNYKSFTTKNNKLIQTFGVKIGGKRIPLPEQPGLFKYESQFINAKYFGNSIINPNLPIQITWKLAVNNYVNKDGVCVKEYYLNVIDYKQPQPPKQENNIFGIKEELVKVDDELDWFNQNEDKENKTKTKKKIRS